MPNSPRHVQKQAKSEGGPSSSIMRWLFAVVVVVVVVFVVNWSRGASEWCFAALHCTTMHGTALCRRKSSRLALYSNYHR
ncbi:hypothetical protein K504DRAFT_35352 [Pleomassaria siparia CBS 279.74]|uniref:Uncharacterized protein n=1 Tax=Pleomassaria siparia CBS 279.74 TaxID=1314801 RepID=A0A6G1KTC0_9PLEO|nr:hypothetical protein K504DRAFT_35352 [Pleomassaria siparia CBS 279.74]